MENNITVGSKEKTWLISINWESNVEKETKDKIYEIASKLIELWVVDKEGFKTFTNTEKSDSSAV